MGEYLKFVYGTECIGAAPATAEGPAAPKSIDPNAQDEM